MTVPTNEIASRVLVVGATGFIGRFVVEASLEAGRPTYVLVRPTTGSVSFSKTKTIKALQSKGAILVHGSINEKGQMEKILRDYEIEIVISAIGGGNLLDQLTLAEAIKAVGTVKRFLPSEFGHDVDRADPVEPGLTLYQDKRTIRRFIEQSDIPYTYICCNSIASWPYCDNKHPSEVLPPLDRFQIYGDGSVKAYFVAGTDIGKFTMMAVDDERTLNKSLHFRPEFNLYNMNDLASLWEKKIKCTLPRVTVSELDLLNAAAANRIPESVVASLTHDIFIKGCQINFEIDGIDHVEVSALYPDECYRTLEDCFQEFAAKISKPVAAAGNGIANQATVAEGQLICA